MDDVMKAAREAAQSVLSHSRPDELSREFFASQVDAALDAYEAKLDETTVRVPRGERWISIGPGGAQIEFREGSDIVVYGADYGQYYETPDAKPVTVFKPLAATSPPSTTE